MEVAIPVSQRHPYNMLQQLGGGNEISIYKGTLPRHGKLEDSLDVWIVTYKPIR
jgi:hypothetical protein